MRAIIFRNDDARPCPIEDEHKSPKLLAVERERDHWRRMYEQERLRNTNTYTNNTTTTIYWAVA